MTYKLVIDTQTYSKTDTQIDTGNDNTQRPKLTLGKNSSKETPVTYYCI